MHYSALTEPWCSVSADNDERCLTAWMRQRAALVAQHMEPRQAETDVLTHLRSPLNVNHTSGPVREVIRDARLRFRSSAGPSTSA
jgi:hypothetical protein